MFYKGACHVFAVALLRWRPDECYTLYRVVCRSLGAYHVYAKTGEWMVDVGGLKREADYIFWLSKRMQEQEEYAHVSVTAVTEDALFQRARLDPVNGPVNEWGLFTDPSFLAEAMDRAKVLVLESDRYRASLMR